MHGVKLAHTFLTDATSPTGGALLAHLVALGHALGLRVTGEGVETAQHTRLLTAAGCDLGQGWYYGRPVPADRLLADLADAHIWPAAQPPVGR